MSLWCCCSICGGYDDESVLRWGISSKKPVAGAAGTPESCSWPEAVEAKMLPWPAAGGFCDDALDGESRASSWSALASSSSLRKPLALSSLSDW